MRSWILTALGVLFALAVSLAAVALLPRHQEEGPPGVPDKALEDLRCLGLRVDEPDAIPAGYPDSGEPRDSRYHWCVTKDWARPEPGSPAPRTRSRAAMTSAAWKGVVLLCPRERLGDGMRGAWGECYLDCGRFYAVGDPAVIARVKVTLAPYRTGG